MQEIRVHHLLQQFILPTPKIKWRFKVVTVHISCFGPEIAMQAALIAQSLMARLIFV